MPPLFLDIDRVLRTHLSLVEDGNKRTGAAAAISFLDMNDVEIEADEEGLGKLTLRVASGSAGKQEIAAFFRRLAH